MVKKTLGVLGGMGPMAGAEFFSLVTGLTEAERDQDHIDVILRSTPSIPDRSAFILGESKESPFDKIRSELFALVEAGAGIIAVTCNTAEYFCRKLQNIIPVPILPICKIAVSDAKKMGYKKIGLLTTQGTVKADLYQKVCFDYGLEYELPSKENADVLTEIIYKYIKRSLAFPEASLLNIAYEMYSRGCDCLMLGCTELSLVADIFEKENYNYIDSLRSLAVKSILACGGKLNSKANKYIKKDGQENK